MCKHRCKDKANCKHKCCKQVEPSLGRVSKYVYVEHPDFFTWGYAEAQDCGNYEDLCPMPGGFCVPGTNVVLPYWSDKRDLKAQEVVYGH